eukprot:gnl/MRDRNA2_/MRDRNA2_100585_c0_seq1.p1 gnl/MRDRNA2_/MRDRNA2_100585_c0~~gnl/MRDRNA2_/MRDRNA2_100585_c0_seq1.p1  ORF type:complete len:517 (-),score=95.69 gnl/MRDRNA2_/MRDRNA2_100585_c0_seq1:190-1740(-)
MISKMITLQTVLQSSFLFAAAKILGISTETAVQEHLRVDDENLGCNKLISWSFLQRAITKTSSGKGQSLLQESQFVSKVANVWDEDDGWPDNMDSVDPVESVLETLGLPVSVDANTSSIPGRRTLTPHSDQFTFPSNSTILDVNANSFNSAHPSNIAQVLSRTTPGPVRDDQSIVLKLTKDSAVPLHDLYVAEVTSQPPAFVDPENSLLQQVPLQRHGRVPLTSDQKEHGWWLPRYRISTILCVIPLVMVMIFAACVGQLIDVDTRHLDNDAVDAFYDKDLDRCIPVEVVGKLRSGQLLLRIPNTGKLFTVQADSKNLRKAAESMSTAGAVYFPQHVSYDANRRWTVQDIFREFHAQCKEAMARIVQAPGYQAKLARLHARLKGSKDIDLYQDDSEEEQEHADEHTSRRSGHGNSTHTSKQGIVLHGLEAAADMALHLEEELALKFLEDEELVEELENEVTQAFEEAHQKSSRFAKKLRAETFHVRKEMQQALFKFRTTFARKGGGASSSTVAHNQ